ncbi:hypothetical protein LCGC14_3124360, partial [marine sediment metagenome]
MKSFEERLTSLEEVTEKLKAGKVSLEEALSLFEQGMKLSRGLEKELSYKHKLSVRVWRHRQNRMINVLRMKKDRGGKIENLLKL